MLVFDHGADTCFMVVVVANILMIPSLKLTSDRIINWLIEITYRKKKKDRQIPR